MKTPKNIEVLFVAGFGPVVSDPAHGELASAALV
jgi:hypothetical protein